MAHSATGNRFRTRPEGFSTFDALHAAHNLSFMDKAATILADSPGEFYGYGASLSASVLAAAQTSLAMSAIILASTALTAAVRFPFIATKVSKSAENAWAGKPKETAENTKGAWEKQVVRFVVTTGCIAALSVAGLFGAVKFQDNQNRSTPEAEQAISLVKSGITLRQGRSFKDQMKPGSPTFKNVSISKRGDVPWYFDANKGSHYLISFDVPHAYTDVLTGKNKTSYRMTVGVGKTEVDTVDSDSKGTIWSLSAKGPNLAPKGNPSYDEGSFRRAAPIQQCVGPADPTCKYN